MDRKWGENVENWCSGNDGTYPPEHPKQVQRTGQPPYLNFHFELTQNTKKKKKEENCNEAQQKCTVTGLQLGYLRQQ